MTFDSVPLETITRVARKKFGEESKIEVIRRVVEEKRYGITRVPSSTHNNVFIVKFSHDLQYYIFRFSRFPDTDRYLNEVHYYEQLRAKTEARVPAIYCLDREKDVAPTPYIIMEYLQGEHWHYLTHPDNPETSSQEKTHIDRIAGRLFAQAHRITTRFDRQDRETQMISTCVDRLHQATQSGLLNLDSAKLERCRAVIENESRFHSPELSLCLTDAELKFVKKAGTWELSFICDVEWVGFRSRYSDLVHILARPDRLYQAGRPLLYLDGKDVTVRPFFQEYSKILPLNIEELLQVSVYYQLNLLSYLAVEESSPEKKQWFRMVKSPLVHELINLIAGRKTFQEKAYPDS